MTNKDKLYEAVEARGPVCVGLDTDFSYLPEDFVDSTLTKGENIVRFNKKLIDATKAVAGCYKVQIAYYESLGLAKGQLEPGYDADMVLVDLDTPYTVDKDKLHSKSHNTPFDGAELYGKVCATIKGGKLTYQAED